MGKASLWATVLVACAAIAARPAMSQNISGDWVGKLYGNAFNAHFGQSEDGRYFGLVSAPDGSVFTLKAVRGTADLLHFEVPVHGGLYVFDGHWDAAGSNWSGTFTANGPAPLTLSRSGARLVPKRPQEEAIYAARASQAEDVSFDNTEVSGVRLAGTFTKPAGRGPFPAIVLVAGSGRHTRDDDDSGHHTLLVLSDTLNRAGFAVLRYDKRGTGMSTGNYDSATTDDFAADTDAAIDYLLSRPDVDKAKVGIIGHSEGGLIGPITAARDGRVAYLVSLAGPAIPGAKNAVLQAARTVKAMGRSDRDAGEIAALTQKAVDAAIASPNFETFHAQLGPLGAEAVKKGLATPAQVATVDSFWWWDHVRNDRSPSWSKVRVPVLAMYGALDVQVPADENGPAAQAALKNDADATVVVLPRLNHFFQTANTGALSEYDPIEETMSPKALATIVDWLSAHVQAGTVGAKIKP